VYRASAGSFVGADLDQELAGASAAGLVEEGEQQGGAYPSTLVGRRNCDGLDVCGLARERQTGVADQLAVVLGDDVPAGLRDTDELGVELLGGPGRIAGEQHLLEWNSASTSGGRWATGSGSPRQDGRAPGRRPCVGRRRYSGCGGKHLHVTARDGRREVGCGRELRRNRVGKVVG
jgi:hypothetical protein